MDSDGCNASNSQVVPDLAIPRQIWVGIFRVMSSFVFFDAPSNF